MFLKNRFSKSQSSQVYLRAVVINTTALVIVAVITLGLMLCGCGSSRSTDHPLAAAIVDQLSLTLPNPNFVASATNILEEAGYTVDYYPGEQVTIPLYRDLPSLGYDLVILRVHSGICSEMDAPDTKYLGLFSGEPYTDNKYMYEGVGKGTYVSDTFVIGDDVVDSWIYIIGARFVENSMIGHFNKTVVILMGCDGLKETRTAQAFLNRGAEAVVGWTDDVSNTHTDATTLDLLKQFLLNGLTINDAVEQTKSEAGPDPFTNAELQIVVKVH